MNRKIILASRSPRRRQLLEQIGLKFEVRESEYEENMSAMDNPYELSKFLALKKCEDVARHYEDAIIIAADTFVFFEGKFIGKPKNNDEVVKMMRSFSGVKHEVVSGLAIIDKLNNKVVSDYGVCKIKFSDLDDQEIINYAEKTQPFDKAGGYALQEEAGAFLESVEGDYYSVVGLPLNKVYLVLKEFGVEFFKK